MRLNTILVLRKISAKVIFHRVANHIIHKRKARIKVKNKQRKFKYSL